MHVNVAALAETVRVIAVHCDGTPVDGYIVWAHLEDGSGNFAHVCIDHRRESPTCHRLFEGARHPRDPQAVMIELGAIEEGIVIPLLSRQLDSWEPWQQGVHEFALKEIIQEALLRLGDASETMPRSVAMPLEHRDHS